MPSRPPHSDLQRREQRLDLVVVRDVAAQDGARAEVGGELDHPVLQVVVDVGERQRGAFALAGAGDAVGDGPVRQHTGDEDPAIGEKAHGTVGGVDTRSRKDTRPRSAPAVGVESNGSTVPKVPQAMRLLGWPGNASVISAPK